MEEKYKNRELVFNESHGFFGENAYGRVMSWDKANQKLIPVICGHGGSMWLCEKCFNKMKK